MSDNFKINDKYKDRLFRFIFGHEENKAYALDLYNAINNTDYKDVSELEFYTIEDVIYIKMKNDVALILDSYLNLWEQQSSYNPNMPLRGLMYFGQMYSKYIKTNALNIYGKTLVKIPTPRYIVFYNGLTEIPPVEKMKLSDAFINPDKSGDFEWTAVMYNLNNGKNDVLRSKCKPLHEYMMFIERIRDKMKEIKDITVAVDAAVVSCINDGILKDFLLAHRAEVVGMVLTEFDEKTFVEGIKQEGREEGREEEQRDQISKMLSKGKTPEQIADFCDYPIKLVLEVQSNLKYDQKQKILP